MNIPALLRAVFCYTILLVSVTAESQSLKIVFEKTTHTPPSRIYDYMPAEAFLETSRYTFIFSGDRSYFTLDSLKISGNSPHTGWKAISSKDVTKDWSTKNIYYRRGNMQKGYALLDKMDLNSASNDLFETVPEFKTILGIKCQKMASKMGGELWFTTSIPYADGPFPFAAPTPGLVLLYRDESYEYRAVNLETGNQSVEIPKYEFVTEARAISLSVDELKSADRSDIIILDESTPNDTWMKFDGK